MEAIRAEGLTRTYNGNPAVQELSFDVQPGELFGFLGPNGAGKTTTIRMLTGQLRPTSGQAWVAGIPVDLDEPRLKERIGVAPEHQNLYERMTGRENLLFSARLYGIEPRRVDEALAQVELSERGGERIQNYSNGMKQRILIARALLHRPQVLFLDEPTRGLDPASARSVRELITEMVQSGVTVFLTTHYMEEADQLCGRVAILDQGRIVALDTPQRLKSAHGDRSVQVVLPDGRRLQLSLERAEERQKLSELAAAGNIASMQMNGSSLEDVFIKLTGRRILE
jgi:ABC-2 type transport system ATP-binding protein